MAFIPPIVSPLLQVINDLTAALNETRQYLGLPPVDAQSLIDRAYAATGQAGYPTRPVNPTDIPPVDTSAGKKADKDEPAEQAPSSEKTANTIADGKYHAKMAVSKNGKFGFEPSDFSSTGLFIITVSGEKATFKVKPELSDADVENWSFNNAPEVCEGSFDPIDSTSPNTDTPGTAHFLDGFLFVDTPAVLS